MHSLGAHPKQNSHYGGVRADVARGIVIVVCPLSQNLESWRAPMEEGSEYRLVCVAERGLLHDQVTVSVTRPDWPVRS